MTILFMIIIAYFNAALSKRDVRGYVKSAIWIFFVGFGNLVYWHLNQSMTALMSDIGMALAFVGTYFIIDLQLSGKLKLLYARIFGLWQLLGIPISIAFSSGDYISVILALPVGIQIGNVWYNFWMNLPWETIDPGVAKWTGNWNTRRKISMACILLYLVWLALNYWKIV